MMKKQWLLVGLSSVLCACSSGTEVKEATGTYKNDKGEVTTAKIKVEGEQIKSVDIDETAKGKDKTKKELGSAYNMKQASKIGKEWDQQVAFFENYVAKNGIKKITLDANGKAENTDVLAGCTISVSGFMKAIEDAQKNMK